MTIDLELSTEDKQRIWDALTEEEQACAPPQSELSNSH